MSDQQQQVELNLDDSNEDFSAGFEGTPTATPEQPVETPADQAAETPPAEQPQYRQITTDEYDKLMNSAASVEEMRATLSKQFDTAFGKIGGVERMLKQFQDQTPAGQPVEITMEDLADLAAEYPDLAQSQLKVLQKVAGKMRGTGPVDEERIQQVVKPALSEITTYAVEQATERAKMEISAEALDDTHEGWREIVGLKDKDGNIPDTEYRRWLATQPEEYQKKLNSTYSYAVIGRSIDKFNEHQQSLKKKAEADRRDRFESAVTPAGDGGYQPRRSSDDDDFAAGFADG